MKNRKFLLFFIFLLTSVIIYSCKKDPSLESEVFGHNDNHVHPVFTGEFPDPKFPEDNILTRDGVQLGRMLFYEKDLSRTATMSCATCHDPNTAFSDTNRFSLGVTGQVGTRQAMAIFNLAWNDNGFFWDGRSNLLRHQSLIPIQDPIEMDESLENVVSKLQARSMYRTQFQNAFGTDQIDTNLISLALEQFMHSIVSNQSKYDDYIAGNATLTAQEERGRVLFFNEYTPAFPSVSGADCQHCHGGANFENDRYMNNGLDADAQFTDIGREMVTGLASDRAKFKVPSLRNIELTPPYMHDGRFKTLEEVVDHYDQVTNSSTMAPEFLQQLPNGLQLSQADKDALVAFLKTLTDPNLATNPDYSNPF